MSVEMKLGRWEDGRGDVWSVIRNGCTKVDGKRRKTWASECGRWWFDGGLYYSDNIQPHFNLIRYLGPLELSPTPACADQAGTPVVSHVSTETAGEQLRRMRERYNAMDREASIYSALLAALDQAKSDLGERIRAMEKEHDL